MSESRANAVEPSMEDILASIRRIIDEEDAHDRSQPGEDRAHPYGGDEYDREAAVAALDGAAQTRSDEVEAESGEDTMFPERHSEHWNRATGRDDEREGGGSDIFARAQSNLEASEREASDAIDALNRSEEDQIDDTPDPALGADVVELSQRLSAERDDSVFELTEALDRTEAEADEVLSLTEPVGPNWVTAQSGDPELDDDHASDDDVFSAFDTAEETRGGDTLESDGESGSWRDSAGSALAGAAAVATAGATAAFDPFAPRKDGGADDGDPDSAGTFDLGDVVEAGDDTEADITDRIAELVRGESNESVESNDLSDGKSASDDETGASVDAVFGFDDREPEFTAEEESAALDSVASEMRADMAEAVDDSVAAAEETVASATADLTSASEAAESLVEDTADAVDLPDLAVSPPDEAPVEAQATGYGATADKIYGETATAASQTFARAESRVEEASFASAEEGDVGEAAPFVLRDHEDSPDPSAGFGAQAYSARDEHLAAPQHDEAPHENGYLTGESSDEAPIGVGADDAAPGDTSPYAAADITSDFAVAEEPSSDAATEDASPDTVTEEASSSVSTEDAADDTPTGTTSDFAVTDEHAEEEPLDGLALAGDYGAEDVYQDQPPDLDGDYRESLEGALGAGAIGAAVAAASASMGAGDEDDRAASTRRDFGDFGNETDAPDLDERGFAAPEAEEMVQETVREEIVQPDFRPEASALVSMTSEEMSARALASLADPEGEASRRVYGALRISEEKASDSIEGVVRDLLRPMLREWLDDNLPTMVEGMVRSEVERISAKARRYRSAPEE